MKANEYGAYIVTQFVAAVLAGLLVNAVGGKEIAGATASTGKMLVVEFLFTFLLGYVVLNVATAKGTAGNSFYGLAIGFVVVVGAISVGWISGAAFNPAIALGASVLGAFKWSHLWIYLVADFLGGAAGAGAFLYIQGEHAAAE
jgi:aquaporin Z